MGSSQALLDLYARRRQAQDPGSERARVRRELSGKLSPRGRIDLLVDEGSFFELDEFGLSPLTDPEDKSPAYGDGVVAGTARVNGRPVAVYAQDVTVLGGSVGAMHSRKMLKALDLAGRIGCPVVAISDSGGARLQEGVDSMAGYAEIGRSMVRLSGIIPQIWINLGSCAGGAAYGAALSDFVAVVDGLSYMYVTGPEVIERAMGRRPTHEELGGARLCCEVTGTAHYLGTDESDAIDWVRILLAYLPANNREGAPRFGPSGTATLRPEDLALDDLVPASPRAAFDMDVVIRTILDDGEFLEVAELYGRAVIVGLGCLDGSTIGLVATRPGHLGGSLDGDASDKCARFVRFCDAMNLPVVTLVDTPGFLPGIEQEHASILTRGAKVLYAYAEATVPLVTVVVRKAYGGAYAVLGSKHVGADINLAWPSAEIAIMGAASAVQLLHRSDLAQAAEEGLLAERTAELVDVYRERLATPYAAAARGFVDRVIAPHETRTALAAALRMLHGKQVDAPPKKHGNIPL